MPRPALRSKAQKRKKLKTPGHQKVIHYWRKKPSKAHCSSCKKPLQSIPRLRVHHARNHFNLFQDYDQQK
ncbi:MAG: hypothetical protein ACTSP9_14570 [Promethearchaeota archaeon]